MQGYGYVFNDNCVLNCPSYTIPMNGVCFNCDPSCATCLSNQITCTSCLPELLYYVDLNKCLQSCPDNTFTLNDNCYDSCPSGYFQ
jgi:hypothetical protein